MRHSLIIMLVLAFALSACSSQPTSDDNSLLDALLDTPENGSEMTVSDEEVPFSIGPSGPPVIE